VYLLSSRRGRKLSALRDATWIAGCERCRSHLLSLCADEGFEPRIGYTTDDMVVMQALGHGRPWRHHHPGLALRAHRTRGIIASELPGSHRHVYAATYGEAARPARHRRPPGRTRRYFARNQDVPVSADYRQR